MSYIIWPPIDTPMDLAQIPSFDELLAQTAERNRQAILEAEARLLDGQPKGERPPEEPASCEN